MTEYGRGPGSEPWHPEDPLYGDGGWGGQQAEHGQPPYGGQGQYHPQQPQQAHPQQQPYGDWDAGQQQSYGHQQGYDPLQAQYNGGPQPHEGGWDTGQPGQVPYGGDPADPYGQQSAAYGDERPDFYGTPEAYPPPEPPGRRRAAPEPDHETGWDPGPDQGEHAFFAGGDEDEDRDAAAPGSRSERRGRGGKKPKKRRSGCACLVVAAVFAGGIGGVGYFGYQFYQDRFGTAPDYTGNGTSARATVTIDKGATGGAIGQALKDAGVVKSVDAFVSAQGKNPDGQKIQAGVYTLNKEMSAASALELMLSPKSRNNLIIPEGKRNKWVYEQIDKRLELTAGTTKNIAQKDWKQLGLPQWAVNNIGSKVKDPLEGFLYPSSYPVAKGQKPEDVLKKMVAQATEEYEELGVESKAKELKLKNPFELITVASLVQAEGKTHEDFRKMAEVIYNRLKPGNMETVGFLQFDSTFNYLMGQSKIKISEKEIKTNPDPYNTYKHTGLPPGPIGNPGEVALKAAVKPSTDGWLYFVATDGMNKTEFAKTHAEFLRLKEKFNASTGG
ncbi:endolytic transglycosylase MltG [Streptomyces sp. NRRL B-1347]|uniref:endolytic transglycosylase MltG n=1 Tax=Streptomyces sp. NRRL B-1347 TaxID=1476877 RepID=UPI000567AADD|nr:endolytic transglycosylase MltG [Streptomyces sp. NRRL B-1347]